MIPDVFVRDCAGLPAQGLGCGIGAWCRDLLPTHGPIISNTGRRESVVRHQSRTRNGFLTPVPSFQQLYAVCSEH